jgi:hypothetical protein
MSLTGTSANLGITTVGTNHPDFQSAAPTALASIVNGAINALDGMGNVEVHSTAGAITSTGGKVVITAGTAIALTLAAPVAGLPSAAGNDGQRLTILTTTTAAHTVTTPANAINGSKHVATFAAAGNAVELLAYQGVWYAVTNTTTLS